MQPIYSITIMLVFMRSILCGQEIWLFSQPEDNLFNEKYVSKLKTLAQDLNLNVKTYDPNKHGAPASIHTTPAIMYKDMKKAALFAGRYSELDAVKLFLQTAAYLPSEESVDCRQEILVKQTGRTNIGLRLKMTDIKGPIKSNKKEDLIATMSNSINFSFNTFSIASEICFTKSDRIFYLDVHPYATDSLLYLTIECYSPYHCVIPIIDAETHEISVAKLDTELNKLMQAYEKRIDEYIRVNNRGDAFTAVPNSVVDMVLEYTSNDDQAAARILDWNGKWSVEGSPNNPIIYQFPAPLDRYRATFNNWKGVLEFDTTLTGEFVVDVKSLDTGVSDFTDKVLKKYLKAKKYPKATFKFHNQSIDPKSTNSQIINGEFQFKGKTKIISAVAVIRPIQESGKTKLLLQAQFQIPLNDYNVEKPDGPSDAASVVNIFANTLLNSN